MFESALESSEYILFDENNFREKKWKFNFISKNDQKLTFLKNFSKISKQGIHVGSKGGNVLSKGGWGDHMEVSSSKTII